MSLDVQASQPELEPTLLDTEPASDEAVAKPGVDETEARGGKTHGCAGLGY